MNDIILMFKLSLIAFSNTPMKSDYRHDGDLKMNDKATAVDEQEGNSPAADIKELVINGINIFAATSGKKKVHPEFKMVQHLPRFQHENLEHNKKLFKRVNEIPVKKRCTPSHLALAWVHYQGNDVSPIPGTTKIENLNQNIKALSLKLTPEEIAELESIASADAVRSHRYGGVTPTYEDSDTPPLSSWKLS
ncbi:hypothetical protein WN943_025154 [Citrus x changshan-huyou]